MQFLGIDYGRAKVGVAIGSGFLSEPYKVIHHKNESDLIDQIGQIVKKEKIEKIIVGVSESEMGEETKSFGQNLKENLNIEVEYHNETLSSKDAQRLSIESGMSRKKRRGLEDAFAASVMLQSFLDSQDLNK